MSASVWCCKKHFFQPFRILQLSESYSIFGRVAESMSWPMGLWRCWKNFFGQWKAPSARWLSKRAISTCRDNLGGEETRSASCAPQAKPKGLIRIPRAFCSNDLKFIISNNFWWILLSFFILSQQNKINTSIFPLQHSLGTGSWSNWSWVTVGNPISAHPSRCSQDSTPRSSPNHRPTYLVDSVVRRHSACRNVEENISFYNIYFFWEFLGSQQVFWNLDELGAGCILVR